LGGGVSGVDWRALGRDTFNDIVDILLSREYRTRGHAVNGRGGDEGIDYDVDDSKIIFQYKFFCDGFPGNSSRRTQTKRSFKKAMTHDPDEWILVVPATVTPSERLFVTGLGKGKRVKISIRDQVWLTNQLIENPDVAEHYRFSSDLDYIYAKGERFKNNPIVRDTHDVADRIRSLRDSIDTADPNWAIDFHAAEGQITQVLRPKDPGAPDRAPINISFTTELRIDSPEAEELEKAQAFGYTKPIVLSGDMIKDFTISGPRLLGATNGPVLRLEFHPLPDEASPWKPSEMVLCDGEGEQLGMFLGETRLLAEGQQGFTLQSKVGRHVEITFRCPRDLVNGGADFTIQDLGGAPVSEVFDTADFMIQLAAATTLEIRTEQNRVALMDISGRAAGSELTEGFGEIRAIAEDLRIIETATRARFRYPSELKVIDRIMIRNLRLMLEGHCVAHPTATRMTVTLNGEWDADLEQLFTTEVGWLMHTQDVGELTILGQAIRLPHLSGAAAVSLEQDEVDEIRAAFTAGTAAGHEVNFRVRPWRSGTAVPGQPDPRQPAARHHAVGNRRRNPERPRARRPAFQPVTRPARSRPRTNGT
jgi:hypothetical protein